MCNDVKDYTTEDEIYIYKNTNVLKNKFDIIDFEELKEQEMFFTSIRITELQINPIKDKLDFNYLKKIHDYIFQDIYEFSGEIRRVDIEKGNSKFCMYLYIEEEAAKIFKKLEKEEYFVKYDYNEYCEKIADFMGDIIALHPFREGNGRASRELFKALCLKGGYNLNYDLFTKEKILEADIAVFNCNKAPMIQLMEKGLLEKINKRKRD